jgi:phage terminase large subunit
MAQTAHFPEAFHPLSEQHRYKVCYGGRGGGRSWAIARLLLLRASNSKLRLLCTREHQKSIQESVHILLAQQIEALELPGWNVERHEIFADNGSHFIFAGLHHEPHKIKSMEGVDVAWVEEAQSVSAESWDLLTPTIRKDDSEIWLSFNPERESDATYQRFVVNPPPGAAVIKTTWRDNPWFPSALALERDYCWRVDPERASHIWDGECRSQSQAAIFGGKYTSEAFEPAADWDGPYYGADWGFSQDPSALIRFWVDKRRLYIDYEAWGVGVDIDETPALFRLVPGSETHLIRADCARPETISYMNRHGYSIRPAKKWSGCVEDGIVFLRQFEQIVIHPRCRHTLDEFRNYSYKVDRLSGDVLPIVVDSHNHMIDSLRYGIEPLMQRQTLSMALVE